MRYEFFALKYFLNAKNACVFFVIKEGVLNEPIFLNEKGEK